MMQRSQSAAHYMRYFFRPNRAPAVRRILLIESGSRELIESLIPQLTGIFGAPLTIDLVTCFGGLPKTFHSAGRVYRVTDYTTPRSRATLYRELQANHYQVTGLICSAEPIMNKWKWMLALRIPAHTFLLNENGDYVWLDRDHLPTLWDFARFRSGLAGAGAVRTVGRLLLFPFSLLFLLLYAAQVHLFRAFRNLGLFEK